MFCSCGAAVEETDGRLDLFGRGVSPLWKDVSLPEVSRSLWSLELVCEDVVRTEVTRIAAQT